jgi:hypothetical protein
VRRRRWIVTLLGALVVVAAVVTYFFVNNPCSDIFPCHDSPEIVRIERHELLINAKRTFARYQAARSSGPGNDEMPRPLAVGVTGGPDATLTVDAPLPSNDLRYAQTWYEVYHHYHGGTRLISLHVVWKSGSCTQTFPISDV